MDENPMPPVQSQYSIECTRGLGFPSVVTILSPIKTQNYTHVFSVAVQFVPQPTWNLFKKLVDWQTFVPKLPILEHLKLERT